MMIIISLLDILCINRIWFEIKEYSIKFYVTMVDKNRDKHCSQLKRLIDLLLKSRIDYIFINGLDIKTENKL